MVILLFIVCFLLIVLIFNMHVDMKELKEVIEQSSADSHQLLSAVSEIKVILDHMCKDRRMGM